MKSSITLMLSHWPLVLIEVLQVLANILVSITLGCIRLSLLRLECGTHFKFAFMFRELGQTRRSVMMSAT